MAEGQAPAGPAGQLLELVGDAQKVMDMPNLLLAKATLDLLKFLPKMPAARLFGDLVFQFGHTHPHPPTFGVPIPSVGPILAAGAVNVLINGLPAARNGDLGLAAWCGGYFPIFEVMFGSSHVFIGGSRAARMLMDPTLHCLPDMFGKGKGMSGMTKAIAKAAAKEAAKAAAKQLVQSVVMTGAMKLLQAAAEAEQAEATESEGEAEGQAAADAEVAAAKAAAEGVEAAMTALQMAADAAAAAMGALLGKDPGVGFPLGFIMMGSPNVLIGGFPMPGWSTILKGLGKMLKPLIRKIQLKLPPGRLRQALCAITGHPVEIASGRMFTSKTDFQIDGRVPINFERIYDTSAIDYEGSLGWGWTHPYERHLWESKKYNCLILRDNENRQIRFDKLTVGARSFQPLERMWLERSGELEYKIFDCKDGLTYRFGATSNYTENFTDEKNALRLLDISDRNGNRVELEYRENLLSKIRNGTETHAELFYNSIAGKTRLTEIVQHLKNGQTISLMRFAYNEKAELHTATDRTYQPYIYEYENRLMTRETNRNKLSFYFEYEGEGTTARCVHTWGDGNIFERWITYSPKSKITKVRDSLGGESIYHYNDLDLITKFFNSEGGISQFEYGEFGELIRETDELGRVRTYVYDEQLNRVGAVQEDGTTIQHLYDKESCIPAAFIDEAGAEWKREFDDRGNITASINPLGAKREYEYNQFGDITKLRDSLGNETNLEWTTDGFIKSITRPRGGKIVYSFNERNLLGEADDLSLALKLEYKYDDAGRIKSISEINSRRENIGTRRYVYDDENNLTQFADALGNRTNYGFAGYNKMVERVDALGFRRGYKYDREERLTEIINERGENYRFAHDLLGRIIEEIGYDEAATIYKYNQGHETVYQKDALNRETFYRWDERSRLTGYLRSDTSTLKYEYDECGRIVNAENAQSSIKFTYNSAWQVTSEDQDGQIINHEYDAEGRRTARIWETENSQTKRVEYDYNEDGFLSAVQIGERKINYSRDEADRVIARQMPNGIHESFSYDGNGRLSNEKVSVGTNGRELVGRAYEWDANGNIIAVNDSLRGERKYFYNAVERISRVERIISGQLIDLPENNINNPSSKNDLPAEKRLWQAEGSSGTDFRQAREIEEFQYDGDGNLLERSSNLRGSRKFSYDRGDRLQQQEKTQYIYDAVGNLIEKKTVGGTSALYSYDGDNRLISIYKNDQKTEFEYDAFGRRILKKTDKNSTKFLWDGDIIMCENDVQYVHESFAPLAKIKDSQIEIYHTDYLGTPKEVTGETGEIVWQGTYDEYGRVSEIVARTDQKIRFQGQFEDEETGLFYNRFRYYDADDGRYINQDPIRLSGGNNLYQYCPNPLNWIDPLGLVVTPTIGRDAANGNRPTSVNATVNRSDLGTGTGTNSSSISQARGMGNSTDDAGHLLARRLGGSGGVDNVFPQNLSVNRGAYRVFEGQVANMAHTHGSVDVSIQFHYHGNSTRPHMITYTATSIGPDGKPITISQPFNNPC